MAKYGVTYSCGHGGIVELFGKTSAREWRLSKYENELCPECKEIAYKEKIAEYESEYGLPELQGSEKQIEWGRKYRYETLNKMESDNKSLYDKYAEHRGEEEALLKKGDFLNLFYKQNRASWWMDRGNSAHFSFKDYCRNPKKFIKYYELETFEIANEVELKDTPTIYPKEEETKTICHIYSNGSDVDPDRMIYIESEKDDAIINVLHKIYGMSWNHKKNLWEYKWAKRKLFDTTTYDDMLVCIGYQMLSNGIPISSNRDDLYDRMINGDYEERCFNWLAVIDDELVYIYANYNGNIADKLKRIVGTKYDREHKRYIVNPAYYTEIRAWAEDCEVKISKKADNLLKQAEEQYLERNVVNVAEKKSDNKSDKIAEILNSSTDILDDLLITD